MDMKHCFREVNEISRRLHQLKSKGEFDGRHGKSQFIRKLKKDMIWGKKRRQKTTKKIENEKWS